MQNCAHCGETNPLHARFCMACGRALVRTDELRYVTVLFADIAGSTAMISGSDPETARARLRPLLHCIGHAISRCGGTIARIEGDGVKALFGAPVALEDHVLRACEAALRIHADAAAFNTGHGPARIRVGINTGPVLLCIVTTDLHVEYSAEGSTTHEAAKAQQSATPGTTFVTAAVARAVEGFFDTAARAPLRLNETQAPMPLFELLRPTGARSRFELALRRGLSTLVDRAAEIARLEDAAHRSASGRRLAAMALVGEAGVGKSRLLWEFGQRLVARGWALSSASGTRGGTAVAFHAVLQILCDLLQIGPGDSAEDVQLKLGGQGAGRPYATPILVLLGLEHGDEAWHALDAAQRASHTQRALAGALELACARRPTALVLDGFDGADGETRAFFQMLSRRAPAVCALLLLEGRPETADVFKQLAGVEVLPVEPLGEGSAARMFRSLAGSDRSLRGLERALVARTAGNPLFIEETVRTLRDCGALTGLPGNFRAASSAELPLSGSIADIIETRIARLQPLDRKTLEAAAAVGSEVSTALLGAYVGADEDELSGRLHRLVGAGFLRVEGEEPALRFSFRHAVTRDVAYRLILLSARLAAHRRLAELLESPAFRHMPDRIDLLAHHTLRAHDWTRALRYLQQAAERAAERSAPREVVRLLDEALAVLEQLPAADRSAEREVSIRLSMAFPLVQLGDLARTAREVAHLERLESGCADRQLKGRLTVFVCTQRWLSGEHAKALAIGRRALALGKALDDPTILVPARQAVGGALNEAGQFAEALSLLSANIDSVSASAPGHPFGMSGLPAVFALSARSWVYTHMGRFADAERDASACMNAAMASGHAFSIGSAAFAVGALVLARGEAASALPMLEDGVRRCEAARLRMWLPVAGTMLALAHVEARQPEHAREVVRRTLPALDDTPRKSSFMSLALVRVYAAIGDHLPARQLLDTTLARAREHGGRTWEAQGLLTAGDLAATTHQPGLNARRCFEEGLALAEELGMDCIAARCRLGLADVLQHIGDTAAAAALRDAATQALQQMGAPGWLSAAER